MPGVRSKWFMLWILLGLIWPGWDTDAAEAARFQWVEISEEDTFPDELLSASMFATEDDLYVAHRDNGDITVQRFDGSQWEVLGERKLLGVNGHDPVLVVDQGVPYLAVIDQCLMGCSYGVTVLRYDESADEWNFLGDRGFTGDDVLRFDFAVVNGTSRVMALFDGDAVIGIWEWDGADWTVVEYIDLSPWNSFLMDVDLDRENGTPYISSYDPVYYALEVAYFDGDPVQPWSGLPSLTVNTGNPAEWDIAVQGGETYFAYVDYDLYALGFGINVLKFDDVAEGWTLVGDTPFYGEVIDPRLHFLNGKPYLAFTDYHGEMAAIMRYDGGREWEDLGRPFGDRLLHALYDLEMFGGSLVVIGQLDDADGPNKVYKGIPFYTVQFNSMGGSPADSVEAAAGSRIGAPEEPARAGYVFGGWYKDANYSAKWNFGTDTVTMDLTLYARWVAVSGPPPSSPEPPAPAAETGQKTEDESRKTGALILVNNRAVDIGYTIAGEVDGRQVTYAEVDEEALRQELEMEGEKAAVTMPVVTDSPIIVCVLNGRTVKLMENLSAVIEIIVPGRAVYVLPAAQIRIDDLAGKLEGNPPLEEILVRIEVSEPEPETARIVEAAISGQGLALVAPPVQFRVVAVYGDQTVEAEEFSAYVERAIAIPDAVDPGHITTAVVVEEDGRIRHVPTKMINRNGRYYARISSLTNSVYSLIRHEAEFGDVDNHWAKEAILDMGSRLIVNGTGRGMYEPDREITRVEFAAILARALGVKPAEGAGIFADVETSAWYGGPVYTAYAWQLIRGFDDGTFRPHDKITREQAMVMIARAMKITGLPGVGEGRTPEAVLASFADAGDLSGWAAEGAADAVAAGIVTGRSADMLAPKAHITRAETAMMIRRLLHNSNLTD